MEEEHNKTEEQIIADQLEFFMRNGSGCAFAAQAARDPNRYEWGHLVVPTADLGKIDELLVSAIADNSISTLAMIFPEVRSDEELDNFIPKLVTEHITLNEIYDTENNRCFRFRAKINEEQSYISGFGPFEYMPITRRSPHTSIVLRVKPRPPYTWHLKPPVEGIIHVADMDMKGLSNRTLGRMWNNSFFRTAGLLGKKPDEESAAKTTFVVPIDRANQIST